MNNTRRADRAASTSTMKIRNIGCFDILLLLNFHNYKSDHRKDDTPVSPPEHEGSAASLAILIATNKSPDTPNYSRVAEEHFQIECKPNR